MNGSNFAMGIAMIPRELHSAPKITFTSLVCNKRAALSDYVWFYLNKEGYIRTAKRMRSTYEQEIYEKNGLKFKLRRYLAHPDMFADRTNPCRFVWEVTHSGLTEIMAPGVNQAGRIIRFIKNHTPNITVTQTTQVYCIKDGKAHKV